MGAEVPVYVVAVKKIQEIIEVKEIIEVSAVTLTEGEGIAKDDPEVLYVLGSAYERERLERRYNL